MTQDCLNSPSTADVSYRLPKGIHVTGADDESDPAIEGMSWSWHFQRLHCTHRSWPARLRLFSRVLGR